MAYDPCDIDTANPEVSRKRSLSQRVASLLSAYEAISPDEYEALSEDDFVLLSSVYGPLHERLKQEIERRRRKQLDADRQSAAMRRLRDLTGDI